MGGGKVAKWWNEQICKPCDAGMCVRDDELRAEGIKSRRERSRIMSDETGGFLSADQIMFRVMWHKNARVAECNKSENCHKPPGGVNHVVNALSSGEIDPADLDLIADATDEALRQRALTAESQQMDLSRALQIIKELGAEVDGDRFDLIGAWGLIEQKVNCGAKSLEEVDEIGLQINAFNRLWDEATGRWAVIGREKFGLRGLQREVSRSGLRWSRISRCMSLVDAAGVPQTQY